MGSRLRIRWFQIRHEVCLALKRTPYPVPSEQSLKRAEIPAPERLLSATCFPDSGRVIAARQGDAAPLCHDDIIRGGTDAWYARLCESLQSL